MADSNADAKLKLVRFPVVLRLWHLALIIVFMVLSVTGLGWMYIETAWGQMIVSWFGDYKDILWVHNAFGLMMLAGFALHILWSMTRINISAPFGPDSLVTKPADALAFLKHFGWIFGLCERPRTDRWSWWEKFDYWAVWWGFTIVGITGLMLYDPVLTSDYLPGWFVNVALWVHRIEAVLAMGHVFTIHFFVEHFRPGSFPFNAAMFDGQIDLEEAREEHPAWIERLEAEGRLEAMMAPEPPVVLRIVYFGVGYAIMGLGLFLLVYALINATALTLL